MKTKVIFRKEFPENGGGIIAVFPSLAGDNNSYKTCLCYAHVGQHSACHVDYVAKSTFPARTLEYYDLMKELESIDYDLKISKRFSRKDLQSRINQVKG